MLDHYLKMGFRSLMKYKEQTLISVLGLAVGFVCFALSALWIRYEMMYDHFHADSERIYIVRSGEQPYQNEAFYPFASILKETFPEVEEAASFTKLVYNENDGRRLTTLRVSPEFFKIFRVEFTAGGEEMFLNTPNQAIVSEQEAIARYTEKSPVGQEYAVNIQKIRRTRPYLYMWYTWSKELDGFTSKPLQYTICSVAKTWSEHSDLKFDYIIPLLDEGWRVPNTQLLVKLRKGVDAKAFQDKLNKMEMPNEKMNDMKGKFTLEPLKSLHLSSVTLGDQGNLTFNQIVLFAIAGFVTILCLLFNYISLFISRMQQKGRELALRLVLGSGYGKLYKQLSVEFLLILMLTFVTGFILIEWIMPHFLEFSGIKIGLGEIYAELLVYIGAILLLSWALSFIPLLKIRNTSVLSIFRGSSLGKGSNSFQKLLLAFQMTVGLLFIFCTSVFVKQMDHMFSVDPGFDRTRLVFAEPLDPTGVYEQGYDFPEEVKKIEQLPEIEKSCGYRYGAITRGGFIETVFPVNKLGQEEDAKRLNCTIRDVAAGYFDVCRIKCVQGRLFDTENLEWNDDKVVINETAARRFGFTDPIGQIIKGSGTERQIIGVVSDMFEWVGRASDPYVFHWTEKVKGIAYRYKEGARAQVEKKITEIMKDRIYGQDMEFIYMDDILEAQNKADVNFLYLLYALSFVCIIGSMFGIYSMVSLACERRRKEVAVRKINGAALGILIKLFLKEYLWLLVISSFIAFPIGYILVKPWVQKFLLQTTINWWLYPLIFILVAVILSAIIIARIWRTLHINPAQELKKE